jgi:hypothetical protein
MMNDQHETITAQQFIQRKAQDLCDLALNMGVALEIKLVPTQPLRMGGYDMVPDAREVIKY